MLARANVAQMAWDCRWSGEGRPRLLLVATSLLAALIGCVLIGLLLTADDSLPRVVFQAAKIPAQENEAEDNEDNDTKAWDVRPSASLPLSSCSMCELSGSKAPALFVRCRNDGIGMQLLQLFDVLAFSKKHNLNLGGIVRYPKNIINQTDPASHGVNVRHLLAQVLNSSALFLDEFPRNNTELPSFEDLVSYVESKGHIPGALDFNNISTENWHQEALRKYTSCQV